MILVLLAATALSRPASAARPATEEEVAAGETAGAEVVAIEKGNEPRDSEESPPPSERGECRFLGVKLVRVLLRDDLIASEGFHQFYERFDCPIDHVGHALGCAAPAARVDDATELQQHVESCWDDPSVELRVRAPVNPTPREGEADGSPRDPRSGTSPF